MRTFALGLIVSSIGCGKVDEGSPPDSLALDAAEDARTCNAEICDGEDDDCDGAIDDGCPRVGATTRGATTLLALAGGMTTHATGNTPFTLQCSPGDAIVGFTTFAYESIDRLGIVCAHVQIASDGVIGTPRTYSVTTTDPVASQTYGGPGGTPTDSMCASGVAIAVAMWDAEYMTAGASIYGLAYTCSQLASSGVPGDARLLATGTPVESVRIGAGNAAVTPTRRDRACAQGSVLTGVTGYYGPWPLYDQFTTVNGLAFQCSEVTAELEQSP